MSVMTADICYFKRFIDLKNSALKVEELVLMLLNKTVEKTIK